METAAVASNEPGQRDHEELLTVAQAAVECTQRAGKGFTEKTLWAHIAKGALPVVRVGPHKWPRVRRSDLERYLMG